MSIKSDERFRFGKNWQSFIGTVDSDRIATAEASLCAMLDVDSLEGRRFLDVGCGSGLFSLGAARLGAVVRSFDYDAESVVATEELRSRYRPDDPSWVVEQGSILDEGYVSALGEFDIVYSWGVLHHTGDLWRALELVARLVAPGGTLFVSIYNDQGRTSRRWRAVKRRYVRGGRWMRRALLAGSAAYLYTPSIARAMVHGQSPVSVLRDSRRRDRGMSRWHDLIDWVGGYPFEVANPEEVFAFFRTRGYQLERLKTCGGGLGCNEFVFTRT